MIKNSVNSISSNALFVKLLKMTFFFFFFFSQLTLFIYLWLRRVPVSVRGLPPAVASGGHSSSRCAGPSPPWPLLLRSTGSRRAGSATMAHGPSRSAACGILPDQGSNPRPLHRQADPQPLRHQGSPDLCFKSLLWKRVPLLVWQCEKLHRSPPHGNW